MKIYIDDIRNSNVHYPFDNDWTVFRTFESFIQWWNDNPQTPIIQMSLDHDMGTHIDNHGFTCDNMDGTAFVKYCIDNKRFPCHKHSIRVHSANFDAARWMRFDIKKHFPD